MNRNLPTNRHRSLVAGILLAVTFTAGACGAGGGEAADAPSAQAVATEAPVGIPEAVGFQRAVVDADNLRIVASPGADETILTLGDATDHGSHRVLLVTEVRGDWVQVLLPVRPNGVTGWVSRNDVDLENLELTVEVDLAARRLDVLRDGAVIRSELVAVGSSENLTPTGTFYITDKLETPNPDGAYGPYALGLSGYSETLTEFAGGEGQIGLHGTNQPELLGQPVSHGCVRLANEVIAELATTLPLGTPVIVR